MKNEINLLPQRSPEAISGQKRRKRNVILFIVLAGVVFFVWVLLFFWAHKLTREEKVLQNALLEKQKSLALLSEKERLQRVVFNKSAGASVILQDKEALSSDITSVKGIIEEDATIKSFSIAANVVKIIVTSADIASAISFVQNLEEKSNSGFLAKLNISSISQSTASTYEISIEGVLSHAK